MDLKYLCDLAASFLFNGWFLFPLEIEVAKLKLSRFKVLGLLLQDANPQTLVPHECEV